MAEVYKLNEIAGSASLGPNNILIAFCMVNFGYLDLATAN